MNRIALLPLLLLNAASFVSAAGQPSALDILKDSGVSFSAEALPAPQPPLLLSRAGSPDGLTGEQLFAWLHQATEPAPGRAVPNYKASKAYMYSTADNTGCGGRPGIMTAYSQVCVLGSGGDGNSYKEQGDANGDGVANDFVNAEHIWPQSYFNSALPMVADLHHLMSTLSVPNGRRANLKFAKVASASYATSSGSKLGREGFEPDDSVKGNVARALFYFIVRYSDRSIRQGMDYNAFWTKNVPMLLQWNRQDPPDAAERRRNDLVEEFQGNRNPFIDDPSLAERVGETVFESH